MHEVLACELLFRGDELGVAGRVPICQAVALLPRPSQLARPATRAAPLSIMPQPSMPSPSTAALPQLAAAIAAELALQPRNVVGALALFDEGNTLPFIARYRKEATGGL